MMNINDIYNISKEIRQLHKSRFDCIILLEYITIEQSLFQVVLIDYILILTDYLHLVYSKRVNLRRINVEYVQCAQISD